MCSKCASGTVYMSRDVNRRLTPRRSEPAGMKCATRDRRPAVVSAVAPAHFSACGPPLNLVIRRNYKG